VSIIGAIIVAGCLVLSFMSDIIKNDLIPVLENDIKPLLGQVAELDELLNSEDVEEGEVDLKAILEALSGEELSDREYQEILDEMEYNAGVDLEENAEAIAATMATIASIAEDLNDPEKWDSFIAILETDFMMIAIIVAIAVMAAIFIFLILFKVSLAGAFSKVDTLSLSSFWFSFTSPTSPSTCLRDCAISAILLFIS
jgi:hypothetical protein